jgi:F-type H+/Na+-transporting ATPase subunit alpha
MDIKTYIDETFRIMEHVLDDYRVRLEPAEVGTVVSVGSGVAVVEGLPGVKSEEIIRFSGDLLGIAFNLDKDVIGVVLLDESENIEAGDEVRRTGRVLDVPVGEQLLGRIVDGAGRPLDNKEPPKIKERFYIEREAPGIMDRLPVSVPLQTGLKVVDALIPIGRGQRELILGDRQTGKTAIAIDAIINQKDRDVICIYCAIAQRKAAVAKVVEDLKRYGAMQYTVVVVAAGEDPPGRRYITPYAATSIGEYFMNKGRDVLIVYDDLTKHATSYRELSLLLRRPPGREAFPGDIFYIHSRLLERATRLSEELGGGSMTALPIIETEAQNISAYIPTNLISITDGQIYTSPNLFAKGNLPPVEVGRSVSRVGGKAQLPAYQLVAGDLKLFYSRFAELERFARFSAQLDEETQQTLERGRRVREILKQPQYSPMPVDQQVAVLLAVSTGITDEVPVERIADAEERIIRALSYKPDISGKIIKGEKLTPQDQQELLILAEEAVKPLKV